MLSFLSWDGPDSTTLPLRPSTISFPWPGFVSLPSRFRVPFSAVSSPRTRDLLILFSILALAAALRFWRLGLQPLWLDEATSASFASRPFWDCIFAEVQHPPLFNALLHFVLSSFGSSDFVLRIPSALFGVASVAALWVLARRLFSSMPAVAPVAASLAAVSPFLIYYSQECRSYSLFILLSLLSMLAFLRFCRGAANHPPGSSTWLALHTFLSALLLYTHYFSLLILLAQEIFYWRFIRLRPRAWLLSRLITAAAFAPWIFWLLTHLILEPREWLGSPWLRIPYALFRYLDGYGIAAPDLVRLSTPVSQLLREEAAAVLLTLAPLLWLLFRGARRIARDPEHRTLFAALLLLPFLPLLLLSPWLKFVHERYLAFQAPFILLLIALGLVTLPRRRRLLATLACAASISFSLAAYFAAPATVLGYEFRFGKEDWRAATSFVASQQPGLVLLAPAYLELPFSRYWDSSLPAPLLAIPEGSGSLPDLGSARRVVLVLSHSGPAEDRLRLALDVRGHLTSEKFLPRSAGIRIFVYTLRDSR